MDDSIERIETTADVKCEFLVKQVEQLTSRITHLEQLMGVGKNAQQRPVFAAVNVDYYSLSDDRRKVTNSGMGTAWQGFLSEQSLIIISDGQQVGAHTRLRTLKSDGWSGQTEHRHERRRLH